MGDGRTNASTPAAGSRYNRASLAQQGGGDAVIPLRGRRALRPTIGRMRQERAGRWRPALRRPTIGRMRFARMTAPPAPPPDDALHFARELADILGERQGSRGYRDILRVARAVGLPAMKLAARETLRILDADGLTTLDGARKRTPGGVFLRLVFEACSSKERRLLFGGGASMPKVFQSRAAFRERFAALVRDHRRRVAADRQTRGETVPADRQTRGETVPADRQRPSADQRRATGKTAAADRQRPSADQRRATGKTAAADRQRPSADQRRATGKTAEDRR